MTQIDRLLGIMRRLRDPENGCPWDKEQTFATIAPYTLEETYEVLDAIQREDFDDLRGELGDLLFQVVFYCQMAEEQGLFAFEDAVDGISRKNGPQASENLRRRPSGNRRKRGRFMGADKTGGKGKKP